MDMADSPYRTSSQKISALEFLGKIWGCSNPLEELPQISGRPLPFEVEPHKEPQAKKYEAISI